MQAIFDLMKARLEAPDMAFFTHYRDDFFVHDRRELVQWGAEGASYVWFVRESGSDIIRLRVCPKHVERGQALLDLHDWRRGKLFHLISGGGTVRPSITEVGVEKARTLLEQPSDYQRSGGIVTHVRHGMRSEIARLRIVWERGWASAPKASVKCDLSASTLPHVTALRLLAMAAVVEDSGSLFTPIQNIAINGEDITDLVARLRRDAAIEPVGIQRAARRKRSAALAAAA